MGGMTAMVRRSCPWAQWLGVAPLQAWLRSRPPECGAAHCVEAALEQALGPVRVGVCMLRGGQSPSVSCDDAVVSPVEWPAVVTGLDVVMLVHPGEVGTRVRSRMAAGPMAFVHCETVAQVSQRVAELVDECPKGPLLTARRRVLCGEVAAIGARFSEVADSLGSALAACRAGAAPDIAFGGAFSLGEPQLAVIGPDLEQVSAVRAALAQVWRVAETPQPTVDAVVAVAPPAGWGPGDVSTLAQAVSQVGRVLSVGALPPGVSTGLVSVDSSDVGSGHVHSALRELLERPPYAELPGLDDARWLLAAERADRREIERLRCKLSRIERDLGRQCGGVKAELARLCEQQQVPVPPMVSVPWRAFIDAPMVAVASGLGLWRIMGLLTPGGGGPAPWIAVLVLLLALLCGAVRGWMHWSSSRRRWCSLVISTLRNADKLDSTSYKQRGFSPGGLWIRMKLSAAEKQQKT